MVVLFSLAERTQLIDLRGEALVARYDHSAVAGGCEILARVEAEAAHPPDRSDASPADLGSVRLRRVFDDVERMALGQPQGFLHGRGEAVEEHRTIARALGVTVAASCDSSIRKS